MKQYTQYVYRDNAWRAVGSIPILPDGVYHINVSGSGSTLEPDQCAALWYTTVNDSRISSLTDGLSISLKIPSVDEGGQLGVLLNINSLGYHPVVYDVNTSIGDRYSVGSTIILTYNASQTATAYYNSSTATTYTGCWQINDAGSGDEALATSYTAGNVTGNIYWYDDEADGTSLTAEVGNHYFYISPVVAEMGNVDSGGMVKINEDGVLITGLKAPTFNSHAATKKYVDDSITALPEPMIFKGSLGTGGTITSLPTASSSNEGFTYKVITAGTYASQAAKVGDTFISDGSAWVLIPSGDEPSGTVTSITIDATSPISIDSNSAITTSGSRTISHANSGVTAGTYRSVTVNATGHVTAGTNPTTISGYGITDAKINNGVITLGSNTITPLTSSDVGAAAAKAVDTSISAASTSINLPTSQAVASFVEGKGYTTNTGTVTGVTAGAGLNTTSNDTSTDGGTISSSGTLYLTKSGVTAGTYQGITVDKYGRVTSASDQGYVTTDTKNTAGSTDSSSKLFLVGATSQAANPQTYSQDTAYVGTDGHLYSNSKQVVNLSDTQSLTNKTYNGLTLTKATTGFTIAGGTTSKTLTVNNTYTLGAACAKSVDSSISAASTSTNLPTSQAVASFVEGKGYVTTDTKNTAGSTNSSSTLYLIGATSQAANPQTYSNSRLYYNNGLYSWGYGAGGNETSTISQSTTSLTFRVDSDTLGCGIIETKAQSQATGINLYTKGYVSNKEAEISLSGSNGTIQISADEGVTIQNVVTPTQDSDAATKKYVDDHTATVPNASSTVAGVLKVRLDDSTHTLYVTNNGQDA